jgi:hypothetical protein
MNEQLNVSTRAQLKVGLPPRELWLHDPKVDGLIETPRDKFGLVDVEKLVEVMKSTIHPSYDWKSHFNDDHHLYWPRPDYLDLPEAYANPHEFRYLQINRLDGPRMFHSWLHHAGEKPKLPDEEVMHFCIHRERALGALAQHITSTKWLITQSDLSATRVKEQVSRRVDDFVAVLEQHRSLPQEFRYEKVATYQAEGLEDMLRLEKTLGRRATRLCLTAPAMQLAA